jgi:hypothetical protein
VLFWGGIVVFVATIIVVLIISLYKGGKRQDKGGKRQAALNQLLMMFTVALISCGAAAWYFRPAPVLPNPPDLPPLDLPGPPLSKWGKVMYLCPLPQETDPRDPAAIKAEIRRNAELFGNAMGVSVVLTDIPFGVRFDVTANGAEGKLRLGAVERFTLQMERANRGLFVTVLMELPGALSMLGFMQIEKDSEVEKTWTKFVEKAVNSPEGKCRLL